MKKSTVRHLPRALRLEPANPQLELKAYQTPALRELGSLKHLVMGASGVGVDSLARRETM